MKLLSNRRDYNVKSLIHEITLLYYKVQGRSLTRARSFMELSLRFYGVLNIYRNKGIIVEV